jgi:hypothetical protein
LKLPPPESHISADQLTPTSDESLDDYLKRRQATIPPIVYLPTAAPVAHGLIEVELRRNTAGKLALLAYTALDRLVDCCGPDQPWALHPTAQLHELSTDQPFEVIYLDMQIPLELRHQPREA